ncbi:hypothetical protein ACFORO_03385 [Amycolatopsis halotolerans]|uniref:Uncharacterized protein n=1 Tax=Amycolatopsis halotolerans TaxID=330083 RepID=A0ABV7Q7E7_9PSEU
MNAAEPGIRDAERRRRDARQQLDPLITARVIGKEVCGARQQLEPVKRLKPLGEVLAKEVSDCHARQQLDSLNLLITDR